MYQENERKWRWEKKTSNRRMRENQITKKEGKHKKMKRNFQFDKLRCVTVKTCWAPPLDDESLRTKKVKIKTELPRFCIIRKVISFSYAFCRFDVRYTKTERKCWFLCVFSFWHLNVKCSRRLFLYWMGHCQSITAWL